MVLSGRPELLSPLVSLNGTKLSQVDGTTVLSSLENLDIANYVKPQTRLIDHSLSVTGYHRDKFNKESNGAHLIEIATIADKIISGNTLEEIIHLLETPIFINWRWRNEDYNS